MCWMGPEVPTNQEITSLLWSLDTLIPSYTDEILVQSKTFHVFFGKTERGKDVILTLMHTQAIS